MFRIVRHLRHEQFLASVAVIIVAVITFGLLALLAGNERSSVETRKRLDEIESHIYQIGAIHAIVGTSSTISETEIARFAEIREHVSGHLTEFGSRIGHGADYQLLQTDFDTYVASVAALIDAAQAGTLPTGDAPEKQAAAGAVVDLIVTVRGMKADQNAEAASAYRLTRFGYAGAIAFLIVSVLVITRLTERRLRRALLDEERMRAANQQNRQFSALVENISDSIIVLDTTGQIVYASPMVEQSLGVPIENVVNHRIVDLLHPDDLERNLQTLQAIVEGGAGARAVTTVVRTRRMNGSWAWIEAVATNRLDVPGVEGIVVNARDVTERLRVEEQLRFHALHDPLTGLVNRTVLAEHVGIALQRSRRQASSFAVMFIDLDNFKLINDTWGHGVGDELLVGVADRLRAVLRGGDTAARFGGDEFVLVIEDIAGVDAAESVAERVHLALSSPFSTRDQEFFTTASIGIFVADGTSDHTIDDMLRYADIAMYRAKRDGRNRSVVYSPGASPIDADRLALETALRRGIERAELELHYQPIVSVRSERIVALEALLRWRHPDLGLVSPGVFIPIAEETGLILPIGEWVLDTACAQLAAWRKQFGDATPRVSVNFSTRQIRESGLVEKITDTLQRHHLTGDCLMLEITESALMGNLTDARAVLESLHDLGVQIALDDFGTGYSSLAYIHDLPIDILKIARSFVAGTTARTGGQAIVSGIVDLAHALDMRTVAEGVETVDQLTLLSDADSDLAQGFYLYRPMPAAAAEQLLVERLTTMRAGTTSVVLRQERSDRMLVASD